MNDDWENGPGDGRRGEKVKQMKMVKSRKANE